jgi:hypothetical protein
MTEDSDTDGESNASGDEDEELLGMYEQSGETEGGMFDVSEADTPAGAGTDAGEAESADAASDDEEQDSPRFDAPLVDEGGGPPDTATGTFYVKFAEESAVTLHEVDTGQIFTLIENPGVEAHDIIEASLVAQPPMEVSYRVDEMDDQYSIPVETSPEPPTSHVQDIAMDLSFGESLAIDREGEGEIHILRIEPDDVGQVAEELHSDELTYKNAARYAVGRVEIRTDDEDGIVSIRYLP